MLKKEVIKKKLVPGTLYRRSELEEFSTSIDRHLGQLVKEGTLKKVGPGLYLYPEMIVWGAKVADTKTLIEAFLKDDRFLMVSFSSYNALGLGTTQLYNHMIVYNHKRHGEFKLDNRIFEFRIKSAFPAQFSKESLLVDMLNNISELAEDQERIVQILKRKISSFDRQSLENAVKLYGKVKTKKLIKILYGKNLPAET